MRAERVPPGKRSAGSPRKDPLRRPDLLRRAQWGSGLVAIALLVAVAAVFGRTAGFGFTNYDDPEYVYGNKTVLAGLSWTGIRWAFTTTTQANWHPLTWLSLMLDIDLFGPKPGAMHLVNVLLHAAGSLVLFVTLQRATGARGRSALVAALFAVHPLHVESVAWIAERKDVLSTLFWFLTLLAWVEWVRRPTRTRRALVTIGLAAGLLAKPMLVTLPVVLVLFDRWPLRRDAPWRRLLAEKADLFALAAASSVITVLAQGAGGALGSLETYPLGARLANAAIALAAYLAKTVWPTGLAAFYPHPGTGWDTITLAAAIAIVSAISVLVVRKRDAKPYLVTGWLWYLVTLVPVLGIVQVGLQSMADRYTYVPLVGVFVMVAWGGRDLTAAILTPLDDRRIFTLTVALAVGVVAILAGAAWRQAGYWRDGVTLFERTLAVTRENSVAENNLGSALYRRRTTGDVDRAVMHYRESVRINPRYHVAFNNLASALLQLGQVEAAKREWRRALDVKPDYVAAACNLAGASMRTGDMTEAKDLCERALAVDPSAACAHYNLAMALASESRFPEAQAHLESALAVDADSSDTRLNLAVVLARQGRWPDAIAHLERLLAREPGNAAARAYLDRVHAAQRGGSPSGLAPGTAGGAEP